MTTIRDSADRRWFLRSAAGAALSVVTMGAHALFRASAASAVTSGCCLLAARVTAWCPLLCTELGHSFRCWSCNNNQCRCCECTTGPNCFGRFTACSFKYGCCEV